jgi:purine-nucleoside phosphorylase
VEPNFFRRLDEALRSVRKQSADHPLVGIITGSGLGSILGKIEGITIPFRQIRQFPQLSVEGHPGVLKISPSVVVMGGRYHLYSVPNSDDVVLPVFLLGKLGVKTLIVTNAAGGINLRYALSELVLIRDHINLTGLNPLRGVYNEKYGPRFPDMSVAYSKRLRAKLRRRFPELREGVYAGMLGPSYETPAEIAMLKHVGADMVGMSTVHEVIAARFLGMEVLGISCITNKAKARSERGISHAEVLTAGIKASARLNILLMAVIDSLPKQ